MSRRKPTILYIPDAHATPEHDNKRFFPLGKFIAKVRPDILIQGGDLADMASLSSYDKGKRSAEGRRYKHDIAATQDALEKLAAGMFAGGYTPPKKIITLGNHEDRINRAANDSAFLEGTVCIEDLGLKEFGWDVAAYKDIVNVAGWAFSHHMSAGNSGKPIGGDMTARALVVKMHQSCVVGHTHLLGYYRDVRPDRRVLTGISAGCYTHPKQIEGWSKDIEHRWWRGVVILEECKDGEAENVSFVSQKTIMKEGQK